MTDPIHILSAARTPMGGLLGELSEVDAWQLGATAIRGAIQRAGIADLQDIGTAEVIMGCVLPAGQGQAPARQAAKAAGITNAIGATTINKMCGSGMKAMMQAYDALKSESIDIAVVGGMESMSRAPHLLASGRRGTRYGEAKMLDHMALDGLTDAYEGEPMGLFAEKNAEYYQFSREDQDAYAIESTRRAQRAIESGDFGQEIEPVWVKTRKGEFEINTDEQPGKARLDKIPSLKPAFKTDGTVTAANASSISDGAAALILTRQSVAEAKGLKPIARLITHASHAQAPDWFTTAPVPAIRSVLQKSNWQMDDVDLFEINEAFAVVPMSAMRELGIDHDKLNVNGGACALGHPIGASGARICVTLVHALKQRQLNRGVAGICIGGGEGTAVAIELINE